MKRVHPSEVGAADLGTLVRDQEAAAQLATEQPNADVWLWMLSTCDEQKRHNGDYVGVHTTSAGAWLALKANAIEVSDGTLSLSDDADRNAINDALNAAEWVSAFSVRCLPLVTP